MTIERLESRRQALALDAQQGDRDAAEELDRVEAEIATIKREQEHQELARREQAQRDTAAKAKAAEKHRAELEARLAQLRKRRSEQAGQVDASAEVFAAALRQLLGTAREMYQISLALGTNRSRLTLEALLGQWLRALLTPELPHEFERPVREYRETLFRGAASDAPPVRRRLAEILGCDENDA